MEMFYKKIFENIVDLIQFSDMMYECMNKDVNEEKMADEILRRFEKISNENVNTLKEEMIRLLRKREEDSVINVLEANNNGLLLKKGNNNG